MAGDGVRDIRESWLYVRFTARALTAILSQMRRSRRGGLGTLALMLTLLVAIGAAGVVDHTLKARRMNRAELREWYCEHKQTRCGGSSSSRIEDAWNHREVGYQLALGVVAVGAALTIVVGIQRQRL
jgi:hypothetical protein